MGDLFHDDPTRELEEVQKVNATEEAENDIEEFHETPSASEVLSSLGELITRHPHQDPRFLYLHATFGSGKTHLLKLIGFATEEMGPDPERLATQLANQFGGFADFREQLIASHVDHLIPVFLNLLDRDASKEPPLPMMMYEAIGRELGFPTDPRWLLAWVWEMELERAPGLWDALQEQEHNGQTFAEVLEDRGSIRSWLYDVLPEMAEGVDAGFSDAAAVRKSIEAAEDRMDPDAFGPDELVERVEQAMSYLSEQRGGTTELLLGLDEVALFVEDNQDRYEEFQETVQALINGPNPVIVGTGQWPPEDIHESFFTESDPPAWFLNDIELRGADTEIIVRNRWLRKSREHQDTVTNLLETGQLESLDLVNDVDLPDTNPVDSYPFRETDLWLLREIMQNLLGRGLSTEHEHIQGRALLVIVRALFTRHGWAEKPVGGLVPWDQIFDLLADDETLIPSWAVDLLARIDNTLGDQESLITETAKTLFLLNRSSSVPATTRNIARLLADSVDADIDEVESDVTSAIKLLERDNYIYDVDEHDGDPVYELLSQEEVTLQEKIGRREVSRPQLRGHILEWLQEHPLLLAEDRRHEVDLADERKVPIRYAYSVLRGIQSPSTPPYDAVGVRILAGHDDVPDNIEQWKDLNDDTGAEDVLVVIDLPGAFLDRLRRMIATQDVLDSETQRYRELEASVREEERDLEERLNRQLQDAQIIDPAGELLGTFGEDFEEGIVDRVVHADQDPKFPNRMVLEKGLQEISDARALTEFFQGNAPWPLEREDADRLGVNTTTRSLENGWAKDFLEAYGDQRIVDGTTLLDQIQERGGDYLGSPLESLAALLLTLATAREIELRRDGQPLHEPDEMGRALRTNEDLRHLEVRMEPPVDRSNVATLRSVHQALLGTDTSPDDPDDVLEEIASWTQENSRLIREIDQQLAQEFSGDVDIEDLQTTLQPAFEGEPLDQSALAEEIIETQAQRFATARSLFQGDHQETWNRFHEVADILDQHYPRENLTIKFQQVRERDELPDPSRLDSLLEDARELRTDHLTHIYRGITDETPPTTEPDELPEALSTWLDDHREELTELLDDAEAEFPVEFPAIRQLITSIDEEDFDEGNLTASDLEQEVRNLRQARKLMKDRDGTTLWQQLEATHDNLRDDHPEAAITDRISRVLSSSTLPDPETVKDLIEQAKQPEEEPAGDGIDALWHEIETLEPGTIVLIDPKEENQ